MFFAFCFFVGVVAFFAVVATEKWLEAFVSARSAGCLSFAQLFGFLFSLDVLGRAFVCG